MNPISNTLTFSAPALLFQQRSDTMSIFLASFTTGSHTAEGWFLARKIVIDCL